MSPTSPLTTSHATSAAVEQEERPEFPANPLLIIASGLFLCRFYAPAESASAGDTALVVLAWTLLSSLAFWLAWRSREQTVLRLDRLDWLLAGLCLAPVISTIALFFTGGHLRFALNMSWEWIGCLLAVFWLRRLNLKTKSPLLLTLIVSMGIVQSGLGIYQNLVYLPSEQARVRPLIENWQKLQQESKQDPGSDFARQRQLERSQVLERALLQAGIPLETHAQEVFLQRLHSSEPFGSFALANTLAGLLAVCLILLVSWQLDLFANRANLGKQAQTWLICCGLLILPLAYCLLLTKSRTAWAGLMVGTSYLLAVFCLKQVARPEKWGKILGIAVLLAAVLVGLGIFTGNLDQEVVTQATLSLKYRLEYWQSSWNMLTDQWLFGTGPGNFRQNYLAYKLPESSEEILDPHNLLFDAWSGGGVLAMACLAGLALLFLRRLFADIFTGHPKQTTLDSQNNPSADHTTASLITPSLTKGAIAASALSILLALVFISPDISPLIETSILLGIGLIGVSALLSKLVPLTQNPQLGLTSATIALSIHLLGAGGYSMPAIFLLLMLLGIGYVPLSAKSVEVPRKSLAIGVLAGLLLSAAGWWLVVRAELAAVQAQANLQEARSLMEARRVLADWSQVDPFSPDPWYQLGNTLEYYSRATTIVDPATPPESAGAFLMGTQRDPRSYQPYRFLAQAYARHFEQSRQADPTSGTVSLDKAIEAQLKSIERYPEQPVLHAELADYYHLVGKMTEMQRAVEKVLQLQQINQQAEHPDRLLPDQEIERLKNLASPEKKTNESAPAT